MHENCRWNYSGEVSRWNYSIRRWSIIMWNGPPLCYWGTQSCKLNHSENRWKLLSELSHYRVKNLFTSFQTRIRSRLLLIRMSRVNFHLEKLISFHYWSSRYQFKDISKKNCGKIQCMKTSSTTLSRFQFTSTQVWSRRRDENCDWIFERFVLKAELEKFYRLDWNKADFFGCKRSRGCCLMVPLYSSRFAMNLLWYFAGSFSQSSRFKLHDADENCFPACDSQGMENFDELCW